LATMLPAARPPPVPESAPASWWIIGPPAAPGNHAPCGVRGCHAPCATVLAANYPTPRRIPKPVSSHSVPVSSEKSPPPAFTKSGSPVVSPGIAANPALRSIVFP